MSRNKSLVLVVDDEKDWQDRYIRHLDELGTDTKSASTTQEALECIQQSRFDLAIVDMYLAGPHASSEGLKVVEAIRAIGDNTAIIISTGFPDVDLAVTGFEKFHINHFLQKARWDPDTFKNLVKQTLAEKASFESAGILSKQFKLPSNPEWGTFQFEIESLLNAVSKDIEPFASETLTPSTEVITPRGRVLQVYGWSRGLGAPIVCRVGRLEIIKDESEQYNNSKQGDLLANLPQPLFKDHPPYYRTGLGALIVRLGGATFDSATTLSHLFMNGHYDRFQAGIHDILNATCQSVYTRAGLKDEVIQPKALFGPQLEVLQEVQTKRQQERQQQINADLQQLPGEDRQATESEMQSKTADYKLRNAALGHPTRNGELVDPLQVLSQFKAELSTPFTLISRQLVANNIYVDKDARAWPIFGGTLAQGPLANELTHFETDLKFSLLSTAPVETYIQLEKAVDAEDEAILGSDTKLQVLYEALRQIREFAAQHQANNRFYWFSLALESLFVAEQSLDLQERMESASLIAAWQVSKLI